MSSLIKKLDKKLDKQMSDMDFLYIIKAATIIGDGRERHIKTYKRLLKIIEKVSGEKINLKDAGK